MRFGLVAFRMVLFASDTARTHLEKASAGWFWPGGRRFHPPLVSGSVTYVEGTAGSVLMVIDLLVVVRRASHLIVSVVDLDYAAFGGDYEDPSGDN